MRENGSESDSSAENSKNWIPPAARAFHERNAREKGKRLKEEVKERKKRKFWLYANLIGWALLFTVCTIVSSGCFGSGSNANSGLTGNDFNSITGAGHQGTAIPKHMVPPKATLEPQPTVTRKPTERGSEPRGKEGLTCTEQAYILSAPGLFGEGAVSDEQLIKAADNDLTARDCAGYW